jgi:hypothetical protein
MYYYVLESPNSRAVRQHYQRLRDILTSLGIAGEMVASSPARTPTELAHMGMNKGYSTIVAVGGDDHINEVATAILGRAVLGVVPIDASELVTSIVGVHDLRSAAEALKFRRITVQSTVLVEPDTIIFLDSVIHSDKLAKASMILDSKARVHAYFNTMRIDRFLNIYLESTHITESKKFLGLFTTGGEEVKSKSHFHAKAARIVTEPILPLKVSNATIASPPLQLRLIPESLKIITKRGTVLE